MSQHKIDIIIPCYNYGGFLDECLDFVTAQSRRDFQVLVMDNASDDDTPEVAKRWMARDDRIRYHRNAENLGAVGNMKLGYEMTTAEYVAILPADDMWRPTFLETTCGALDLHPECTYAYTGWHVGSGDANEPDRAMQLCPHPESGTFNDMPYLTIQNHIPLSFGVFRRSVCEKVGGAYPLFLPMLGDLYLWMRLSSAGPSYFVNENLGRLRFHGENESNNLFATGRSAYDHIHLLDLVFQSEIWPLEIRLLAKARQFQLMTGKTLAETVCDFGGETAPQFIRDYVNPARDELMLVAAKGIHAWSGFAAGMTDIRTNADKLVEMISMDVGGVLATSSKAPTSAARQVPVATGATGRTVTDERLLSAAYQDWLESHLPDSGELEFVRQVAETMTLGDRPRFCIVIDARNAPHALEHTLLSVRDQALRARSIIILHDPDTVLSASASTCIKATLDTLKANLKDNGYGNHDWVLTLQAGDLLVQDALYLTARTIEKALAAGTSPTVLYFDHDQLTADGSFTEPHFKPDANPDLLRSYPYISRALFVRGDWLAAQPVAASLTLATAYELGLRALESGGESALVHVAAILAHLDPVVAPVWAATPTESDALAEVLRSHAQRTQPGSKILPGPTLGTFHLVPPLYEEPLVSIIIPTKDQAHLIRRCIESLIAKTAYPNFEIIVVDNGSEKPEARHYLTELENGKSGSVRVLRHPGPFNFAGMNNRAAEIARGDFILLLNNDTAALQSDWLAHMMRHALRPDVGVVGANLFFPSGQIQHAGVILGLDGIAGHPYLGLGADSAGYHQRAQLQQNFSAVTGACLLVRKALFAELGGLDEARFAVSYNDIDFCLRVRAHGKLVVWTPLAMLMHESSASQLSDVEQLDFDSKRGRYRTEVENMYERWGAIIGNDPAYNPNLSLATDKQFSVETNPLFRPPRIAERYPHRVIAFVGDTAAGARYRAIQPMVALHEAGAGSGAVLDDLVEPNFVLRSGADTLVLQQPRTVGQLLAMESLSRLTGVTRVFDGDDLMRRPSLSDIPGETVSPDLVTRIEQIARNCDRIVVSTEAIAAALAPLHDQIYVVPDRLHPSIWGPQPPRRPPPSQTRKPRAGWTGDLGNAIALSLVCEVVRRTAQELDWVVIGPCPDALRPHVADVMTEVPAHDYPRTLMAQDWDLALIPPDETTESSSAANIQLLEYAWCGLPIVCSDAFRQHSDAPVTGAGLRAEEWIDAIRELAASRGTAYFRGMSLQRHIASRAIFDDSTLMAWSKAWFNSEPTIIVQSPSHANTHITPPASPLAASPAAGATTPKAKKQPHADTPVREEASAPVASAPRASAQIGIQTPALGTGNCTNTQAPPHSTAETIERGTYHAWQHFRQLTREDLANLDASARGWASRPGIHLVCRVSREQFPRLADTLESLNAQHYKDFRADIVSTEPSPGAAFDGLPKLAWHTVASQDEAKIAIDLLVTTHRHAWVCEVPAGAVLDPMCLFRVAHRAAEADNELHALFTDDDQYDEKGVRHAPRFKPDFNADWAMNSDLLGPVFVKAETWRAVAGATRHAVRPWYDLTLRIADTFGSKSIGHIPEPLISLPRALQDDGHAGPCCAAVRDSLRRRKIQGKVSQLENDVWQVEYALNETPMVTIAVPSLDKPEYLEHCLDLILRQTTYADYEVLVIDGGSEESSTLELIERLKLRTEAPVRSVVLTGAFTLATFANAATREARGSFLLLLGDDIRVTRGDWLTNLLRHAVREGVGAVGPRIVSPPEGRIEHAGFIPGLEGMLSTPHRQQALATDKGYLSLLLSSRSVAAVSGSCMLVRRSTLLDAGGMNEECFNDAFADIDICLRFAEKGLRSVTSAQVTMFKLGGSSLEPVSTWPTESLQIDAARLRAEEHMAARWTDALASDSFWSRHLNRMTSKPQLEMRCIPSWFSVPLELPRILAFPVSNAQGEIRITKPLQALRAAGKALPCVFHPADKDCSTPIVLDLHRSKPDVIVAHQILGPRSVMSIRQWRTLMKGAFLVYSVDDLFTDMPEKSSLRQGIPADARSFLSRALKYSDRLVVSTEYLANAYGPMAKDIRIVPNRLERNRWVGHRTVRRSGTRPRIGWAGGTAHEGDLQLIADVIASTAHEVDWIFMGMCPDNIRPHLKEFHAFSNFDEYPARLAALNLDIAVAPLEQIPFNQGKSNLRLLEYGALGIPVVCTDIDPYRNSPACRVNNEPRDWINALRERIHDTDAAEKEGEAMRQWVLQNFIIEDHLDDWLNAHLPN